MLSSKKLANTIKGKCLQGLSVATKKLRVAVAGVIVAAGVLAPYTLMHGALLPPPDDAGRVALMEVAGLYGEQDGVASFLERIQKEGLPLSGQLALLLLLAALAAEKDVTRDMQSLVRGRRRLAGLPYRVKGFSSLMRKIESDAAEKKISLEEAADGISDVLRYTLLLPAESYALDVPEILAALQQKGYTVEKFRNAWGGKFYQGINVKLRAPSGARVELQLHTAQSFAVKQKSHLVYEIRRDVTASPARKEMATQASLAYNALVRVPKGAPALALAS